VGEAAIQSRPHSDPCCAYFNCSADVICIVAIDAETDDADIHQHVTETEEEDEILIHSVVESSNDESDVSHVVSRSSFKTLPKGWDQNP